MLKNIFFLASSLLMATALIAQTEPHGEGPGRGVPIWLGAEFSTFNPDYGCAKSSVFSCWNNHLAGIATYVDANHLLYTRLSAEGEARFLRWGGPGILTQDSYLAGPRFSVLSLKGFTVNLKLLFGVGRIQLQSPYAGSGNYFTFAPGGALDYRIARRMSARVDYEYQRWPSFKGNGTGSGGLTPNGLSLGVSYLVLR